MSKKITGVAAAALLALSGGAFAQAEQPGALVRAVSGNVSVQGSGAVGGDANTALKLGDTIVVSNGSAVVTYPDGCTATITGVHTVGAVSPCKQSPNTSRQPVPSEVNWTYVAVGGVVAAAVIAEAANGSDDDEPSSP